MQWLAGHPLELALLDYPSGHHFKVVVDYAAHHPSLNYSTLVASQSPNWVFLSAQLPPSHPLLSARWKRIQE